MDAVVLLQKASAAGLVLRVEGDKLIVRGPRSAEPIVRLLTDHKPAVMAALASAPSARWLSRYRQSLAMFRRFHDDVEAAGLAWGDVTTAWHKERGERVPAQQCAGCLEPIDSGAVLVLADGCRVHLRDLDCVIAYGKRWRGAAARALEALGIPAPADAADAEPRLA